MVGREGDKLDVDGRFRDCRSSWDMHVSPTRLAGKVLYGASPAYFSKEVCAEELTGCWGADMFG